MKTPDYSPSSMYDGPGNTVLVSCLTCHACTNFDIVVTGNTGYQACKVLHEIPAKIRDQKTYQCDHFIPDPKSRHYDMVMKQLESGK